MANKGRQSCGGCLVLIILIGVGFYYLGGFIDKGFDALDKQQKASEAAQKQLDIDVPLGTEQRLRHDITKALSDSNRNVARVSKFDVNKGKIALTIAFNDNLTQDMIQLGMKSDIADILKAAKESGYNFSDIAIDGTFPLSDKFGNSTESVVVRSEFSRATVNRINWSQFLPDNIYDIADSHWVHPAVQGE